MNSTDEQTTEQSESAIIFTTTTEEGEMMYKKVFIVDRDYFCPDCGKNLMYCNCL